MRLRHCSVLNGKVPYFLTTGNHDYSNGGKCVDRSTLLSDYFPVSRLRNSESFGGVYDKEPNRIDNSYHLIDVAGRRLMILSLEFGPRRDVIRWANEVVARHSDRSVILATHAFTYLDNTRYDWKREQKQPWNPHSYAMAEAADQDVSDGEELWTQLVSQHDNFVMTLNGHCLGDGLGRLSSDTVGGREIQQLLVNFQMRPRGGDGWLRLLEFREDGETVQVYDYSPTRRMRNESPKNQFELSLAPIV